MYSTDMWLMTVYGFFSTAVYQPGTVTVRARARRHLEQLVARFPKKLAGCEITFSSDRDYAWRIEVEQVRWSKIVALLAREQTWSNFKQEVDRRGDHEYHSVLLSVWGTMLRLQRRINHLTHRKEN